jgi:hypothetical protein
MKTEIKIVGVYCKETKRAYKNTEQKREAIQEHRKKEKFNKKLSLLSQKFNAK